MGLGARMLASSCAHNVTEKVKEDSQIGGTALISRDEASHRVSASGRDISGLGCWVWTRFMGKGGKHFRIVQAYRPCKSYGPLTAYSQQQKFFDTIAHTPAEKTYLS
eukprot:scaffold60805_cov32-Attheya_sp.AAC.3